MKHKEGTRYYEADDGKFIVRVSTGDVIGDSMYIGLNEDISDYSEEVYTDESRAEFFASIGMEDHKKPVHHDWHEKDENEEGNEGDVE